MIVKRLNGRVSSFTGDYFHFLYFLGKSPKSEVGVGVEGACVCGGVWGGLPSVYYQKEKQQDVAKECV